MMDTRWENWVATFGQVTAEYEAEREWAENKGVRLKFNLYIDFEGNDRFFVRVTDWNGDEVVGTKIFCRFDEVIAYISDVDCEKYVDKQWKRLRKSPIRR